MFCFYLKQMKRLEELKALMVALVIGVLFILYSTRQKTPVEKGKVTVLSLDKGAFVFAIPSNVLKSECTMFNVAEAVNQIKSSVIVVTPPEDLEYFALATSFTLEGITRAVIFTVNDKTCLEQAYNNLGIVKAGVYKQGRDKLYNATGKPYDASSQPTSSSTKEAYLPINPGISTSLRKVYPGLNVGDIDVHPTVLFIDGTPDTAILQASKILIAKGKEGSTLICYTGVTSPVKADFPLLYTRHPFELAYVKLLWILSNAGDVDLPTLQKLLDEFSMRGE